MFFAAKKKMPFCDGTIFFPIFLLLSAALCLPETHLWNFKIPFHSASGKISCFDTVTAREKQAVWYYDASEPFVATYDGIETKRVPTQVGSYGPLPGSLALSLTDERGLHEVTHWLGKRIDETGYVHLGEREYNPASGGWISADPLGHFASWDLYSFANGNPISFTDPTGRIASPLLQNPAEESNNAPHSAVDTFKPAIGDIAGAGNKPSRGRPVPVGADISAKPEANAFTFRGDTRVESVVFNEGFTARGDEYQFDGPCFG
jgi:RHS repeat-associated protein